MTKEERLELLKMIEKQIYVSSLESTLVDDFKSCAINSIIQEETERLEKAFENEKEKINLYQIELKNTCFDINADMFEINDNAIYFFLNHVKIVVLELSDVYRIARFTEDDYVYDFVNALFYSDDDIVSMNLK